MKPAPCSKPVAIRLAEWVYEAGIGENRAALIDAGVIVEARIELASEGLRAGAVAKAKLLNNAERIIVFDSGEEALLDRIPPQTSEGQRLMVRIMREALPEPGKPKRAKATAALGEVATEAPLLLDRIAPARTLHAHEADALEAAGWSEVLEEAASGYIDFEGGSLRFVLTPAMTLFDVDGSLPPEPLTLAAAKAVGAAIRRHDISGSIGVDFPTLPGREARKKVDEALEAALPLPFERTAMNGFGFVQIVRRRERASLPELIQSDPVGAELRALMRLLERDPQPSTLEPRLYKRLAAHPDWTAELERRTGRSIDIREQRP